MSRLSDLIGEARRIADLLADPAVSDDQRRALVDLDAEVRAAIVEESIDDQRRALLDRADAARAAAAEVVAVHPAGHLGPCPAPGTMTTTRAEVEAHGSGAIWHVDAGEPVPSWWPKTGLVEAMPHPAEVARARAERVVELREAEAADRARDRALHGIAPG